jgi:hypothetical protein
MVSNKPILPDLKSQALTINSLANRATRLSFREKLAEDLE